MNAVKIGASSSLLSFVIAVIGSHVTGTLYPVVPFALAFGAGTILFIYAYFNLDACSAVYLLSGVAAAFRALIFLFPASMMRFDPDAYAVRSQVMVSTGSMDSVVDGFYHFAASFPMLGAQSALLTDLPIDNAYVIFPVAAGLVLPLFAATLARRSSTAPSAGPIAAAIVAVGGPTILFAVAPIPIILAAMYIGGVVIVVSLSPNHLGPRWILLILVFSSVAMFTHKIPMFILLGITGVFYGYSKGVSLLNQRIYQSFGRGIVLIMGTILVLQWVYVTKYIDNAVFNITGILNLGFSPVVESVQPTAAIRIDPSLLQSVKNNIFYPITLAVGGLSGIYIFQDYSQRNTRLLQAAAVVSVTLTLPSAAFGTGPGFQRIYVYGSIFVAALIAVATAKISNSGRDKSRSLASVAIIAILVSNPLSIVATPDHPNGPRQYLSAAEVEGKEFTDDHTQSTVYRDLYYGDEVIEFETAAQGAEWHQGQVPNEWDPGLLNSELYNGTLIEKNYEIVSYRVHVDIYRLGGGWYRLTWDPESALDREYNRFYSNGGVISYRR